MDFDTVRWIVRLSQSCVERLHTLLACLLLLPQASARSLVSHLGQMESLSPLVPLGRLHKREFQRLVRERWTQASQSWDQLIPLAGLDIKHCPTARGR